MSQCTLVNQMIKDAKSDYYSKIITANKSNQRVLFNTVDRLLHRRTEQRYPAAVSKDQLVNDFVAFFDEKISKMRCVLSTESDDVSKFLDPACLKTCDLDPFPSILLKARISYCL